MTKTRLDALETVQIFNEHENGSRFMRFKKSEGLTESERVLSELCNKSFLRLWTYPNLFNKPGKELCDLLVVFGSDVLVFSDKACAYGNSGDSSLDWKRWYKKSIAHSAAQIEKATRWIKEKPEQIFLDAKCSEKLPIALPASGEMRVYRICVALGASKRTFVETGHASLRIKPSTQNGGEPFTIGRLGHVNGWVHVFDESSLLTVLQELSTIPDFIDYLHAKENLLSDDLFVSADSETDLLARYLWYGRTFPPETQKYTIEPNLWNKVEADPAFLAGRVENKISHFWDWLVEYVTDHFLEQSLEYGNNIEVRDYERMARIMAGENRFSRRCLSKLILERLDRAVDAPISSILPSCQTSVTYVLYIGKGAREQEHTKYRKERFYSLQQRCVSGKAVNPAARFIVGIALDANRSEGSSEDFVFMDTAGWSEEQIEEARTIRQELGHFVQGVVNETRFSEEEYPTM